MPAVPGAQLAFLAVNVNSGTDMLVRALRRESRLYLSGADLEHLRLPVPAHGLEYEGERYYCLADIHDLAYHLDPRRQQLQIRVDGAQFPHTRFDLAQEYMQPATDTGWGAFLNYDLFGEHDADVMQTRSGAFLEAGVFNRLGVGLNTLLVQEGDVIRLDTSWTHDWPGARRSLRLGDTLSGGVQWSRRVRLTGVQLATNFALQPGFISHTLPSMYGQTDVPANVDIYVNEALRATREVPAGPFSFNDIPTLNGSGEMSMVVRDMLGRETRVLVPYYTAPELLRPGLADYNLSLGLLRQSYGERSNDFGSVLAAASYRYGINRRTTGETYGEASRRQVAAGFGAAWLLSGAGILEASLAGSRSPQGTGYLGRIGIQHTDPYFSIGAHMQQATPNFTQLGLGTMPAARSSGQFHVGLTGLLPGSLTFSLTHEDRRNDSDVDLVSAAYNLNVHGLGYFAVDALRDLNGDDTVFGIQFTRRLGREHSVNAHTRFGNGHESGRLGVQRNLPRGTGIGYRLSAGTGSQEGIDAEFQQRHRYGSYNARFTRVNGADAYRLGATGGLSWMQGHLFATPRLEESFALVEVPGLPAVTLYHDNQPITQTDGSGLAVIPRLRAYEENRIQIQPTALGLDTRIERYRLKAVPGYRAGVYLRFPVRQVRSALLRVVDEQGRPLPAGARVERVGGVDAGLETFPVAMDGELFISDLDTDNTLRAYWSGGSCEFRVTLPEQDNPLPDLGEFRCVSRH